MGLNLTDRLQAITLPTLLVVGEDDPGTPVAAHEVIQQKIAGSKLVVIPGARHFSNVEQQGAFNAAITAFLAEQV
jgi:3-oxoadipate enol-lactonase